MREVGGLVGRRAVGRSFPKKTWGKGWAEIKSYKKTVPRVKKLS
jgi:hypothetical protein